MRTAAGCAAVWAHAWPNADSEAVAAGTSPTRFDETAFVVDQRDVLATHTGRDQLAHWASEP